METMAKERPGHDMYTWRDRYVTLFQRLWDRPTAAAHASELDHTPPPDPLDGVLG
jgi:hypothetical protein